MIISNRNSGSAASRNILLGQEGGEKEQVCCRLWHLGLDVSAYHSLARMK